MKQITLNIDNKAYNEIKQNALARRMVDGMTNIMDEFVVMIVTAIEDGKSEATIVSKKKRKTKCEI